MRVSFHFLSPGFTRIGVNGVQSPFLSFPLQYHAYHLEGPSNLSFSQLGFYLFSQYPPCPYLSEIERFMSFAYCAMGQETENKGVIWNCTTSLNSFLFSLVASVQVTSIITFAIFVSLSWPPSARGWKMFLQSTSMIIQRTGRISMHN